MGDGIRSRLLQSNGGTGAAVIDDNIDTVVSAVQAGNSLHRVAVHRNRTVSDIIIRVYFDVALVRYDS